jgi:glycosyltransferase involved in cell wall biosynthesis
MKKKRIFISLHYMELGGVEISLIGLLQALDYTQYDVDLFVHRHQGELLQFIPESVTLIPEYQAYSCIESPMREALLKGQWGVVWGRMKAWWRARNYHPKNVSIPQCSIFQYVAQEVESYLPSLEQYGEYDLAISFLQPHNYVLSKVKAKKKACWIHTDYTKVEFDVDAELPIWSQYDHIVSISPDVTKTFIQVFPSLQEKIIEIENILSPLFVKKRADEVDVRSEIPQDGVAINILSVGRFHEQKNFDNIPNICHRILKSGINIRWYIIGFGDDTLILEKIKEAKMKDHVIILGKRTNPYPYMKACDIYAQPSRYEGKSVTVREAQMLCKPVVITNYPTAKSQIQDGVDGVIVPMDNAGCAKGMAEFIKDKGLQDKIITYLHSHDYGNVAEINKLEKLIE